MERFGPFDRTTGQPTFGDVAAAQLQNGNPLTGQQGSVPSVEMVDHMATEMTNVIKHYLGDDAPDHRDLTQLLRCVDVALAPVAAGFAQQSGILNDMQFRLRALEGKFNGGLNR